MSERRQRKFERKTEATVLMTVLDILVYVTALIGPLGLSGNIPFLSTEVEGK